MSTPASPVTPVSATPTAPATTAAAPKPTIAQDLVAAEKAIGVWLTPSHIVLLTLLIASLLGGVYLFESKRADVAEAKAEAATVLAKAAQATAASAAVQNAAEQLKDKETIQAMQAANAQLVQANQQLQKANTQLTAQLTTQQKKDAALPPSAQAQRWQQLVPTAAVTPTSTGFSVDAAGGLATIVALEEIPIDRQRIANLSTELAQDEQQILNDAVSLKAEQAAHASDVANSQKELVAANAETKKVQADYNAYKKKSRRNAFRWFFAGVVVGIVGGHAAGF